MSKTKKPYFQFFGGESRPELMIYKDEAAAIKSLATGTAQEWQQKRAVKVIVEKICRLPHSSFAIDPNITNFNEGARWVGVMLAQILITDLDKFVDPTPKSPINNKKKT